MALDDKVAGGLKIRDYLSKSTANLSKSWIEKSFLPLFYFNYFLTCLIKSTISCSVVSLVMNSSRSSMMSLQMGQVRSFLLSGTADTAKMTQAKTTNSYKNTKLKSKDSSILNSDLKTNVMYLHSFFCESFVNN